MVDIVDSKTRSRMMAGIGPKNTRPELAIRKGLHRLGFRYRLHDKNIPGNPDLVLPKHNALIFVNGCFWHGHQCDLFRWPSTRPEFWREKIGKNMERDQRNLVHCKTLGWRVLTIWECALKGPSSIGPHRTLAEACSWLLSNRAEGQIASCSNLNTGCVDNGAEKP